MSVNSNGYLQLGGDIRNIYILLLFNTVLFANIIHVNNDAGQHNVLEGAFNSCSPGDTILIYPGLYTQSGIGGVWINKGDLLITGYGEGVEIYHQLIIDASNIIIKGLNFQNGSDLSDKGSNTVIINNKFESISSSVISYSHSGDNTIIANNFISNNAYGFSVGGYIFSQSSGSNNHIVNNLIINNDKGFNPIGANVQNNNFINNNNYCMTNTGYDSYNNFSGNNSIYEGGWNDLSPASMAESVSFLENYTLPDDSPLIDAGAAVLGYDLDGSQTDIGLHGGPYSWENRFPTGCMDSDACNYNPEAFIDDGSCEYDCTPPDLYPISDQTIYMGQMLNINLEAYDPDLSEPYWFGSYEITTHTDDSSNVNIAVYNGNDVAGIEIYPMNNWTGETLITVIIDNGQSDSESFLLTVLCYQIIDCDDYGWCGDGGCISEAGMMEDVCWPIPGDDCDCEGNEYDYCGICGGDGLPEGACDCDGNVEDECGICGGDNTYCADCAGVPNGNSYEDMCGACDADSSNDCLQDCHGEWGGDAVEDCTGECGGEYMDNDGDGYCNCPWWEYCDCNDNDPDAHQWGAEQQCIEYEIWGCCDPEACNYNPEANSGCWNDCQFEDCNGDCGGMAYINNCNICVEGNTGYDHSQGQDCMGICFGDDNYFDDCGIHCGDNSSCSGCMDPSACNYDETATIDDGCWYDDGDYDCEGNCVVGIDCTGSCGTAFINECGVCVGGNTGFEEDSGIDCNGECFGFAEEDECGVCGGDNSSCADCSGEPNGDCEVDVCGVCCGDTSSCMDDCYVPNGDNSSCSGCTDHSALNYDLDAWMDDGSCIYNTPPVAVNDTVSVNEDSSIVIDVLANDYDEEGHLISIVNWGGQVGYGDINWDWDSQLIEYSPSENFFGEDQFYYTICDNPESGQEECSTGTVFITILPVNDPPEFMNQYSSHWIDANDTFVFAVNAWDMEEDTLIYEVWGDSPDSSFYLSGGQQYFTDNMLNIIPGLNWSGTLYDTIRVFDGQDYSLDVMLLELHVEPIWGCTDSLACNYDPNATEGENEINCYYPEEGYDCYWNCTTEFDCNGECGGNAEEDYCGVCDTEPENDCVQDCAGTWGGNSLEDECGICGGDNSSCVDCAGFPNGSNTMDNCGYCDNDPENDCILDCNGEWGGEAIYFENCDICEEWSLNFMSCVEACDGNWYYISDHEWDNPYENNEFPGVDENGDCCFYEDVDECNVCSGTNECYDDCGIPYGNNESMDDCGICFGNGWDNCDDDDDGVSNLEQWGYGAYNLNVSDVPDDQGGRVYLNFHKSFYDTDSLRSEIYTIERNDDGTWVGVLSQSAYGADEYTVEVLTLYNNVITEYRIIANMDEGLYVCYENGYGESIDNIMPATPEFLYGAYELEVIELEWSEPVDDDFSYFNVYKNSDLITNTINAYYTDSEVNYSDEFEYYITAVDANNNESESSETLSILAIYYGDANGDTFLNILDLVLIANMLLVNDYNSMVDMNEDGTLDVLDLVLLVNIILEI